MPFIRYLRRNELENRIEIIPQSLAIELSILIYLMVSDVRCCGKPPQNGTMGVWEGDNLDRSPYSLVYVREIRWN